LVYGKVNKRLDCREKKSIFNSKSKFFNSFQQLIADAKSRLLVISFSNEGFINKETMQNMLAQFGKVETLTQNYKRYVGAQIGIYNQKGEKVGKVKSLYNEEYLFVVQKDKT
jgi:adenine-specific DNA-methyltransferase